MKRGKRDPIRIPGQKGRTRQPKWGKEQINVFLMIIACLAGHIWYGVNYVREQDAQWVTMHIDDIQLITGRYTHCKIKLSYRDEIFTEDISRRVYERLKELSQVEVLYLPGTDCIEFEKDAAARRWIKFTWVTIGFVVILLVYYKDDIRKLNR